jgi:hypothetical protein
MKDLNKNRIFYKTGYKGIFVNINGFGIRCLTSQKIPDWGKLTGCSSGTFVTYTDLINEFPEHKEYFDFIVSNYLKIRLIWNTDWESYKRGDLYNDGFDWNLVCHHISYYRRSGFRSYEDSWKLGVAGLNTQLFKKYRKYFKTRYFL